MNPAEQIYTDQATGRRYAVDSGGTTRWLDAGPAATSSAAPTSTMTGATPTAPTTHKPRRWPWIVGIVVAFLVGMGVGGSGKSSTTSTTSSAPTVTTTVTVPAPAAAAPSSSSAAAAAPSSSSAAPQAGSSDKGWTLVSLGDIVDDGIGDLSAPHVRVKNGNSKAQSATFTVTLSKNGQVVATLHGAASQTAAGQTITVQLISQDKFQKGPFTSEFQVDVSF